MPAPRTISLGCSRYDHTDALLQGAIPVGEFTMRPEPSTDIAELFERVMRGQEFDVAELGFTFFARSMDLRDPPFYALPVFLLRKFQHSTTFINSASGIRTPSDLAGKTVGEFALFGHDMGVWPKGIFRDDYGLDPAECKWIVGGVTRPMPPLDFVPLRRPPGVSVEAVPVDGALGPMLESGEVSALISAQPPEGISTGSSLVRRLFPDYRVVEADYHARTGIFPIMHLVVAKRELIDHHPGLARALFTAFDGAKAAAIARYRAEEPAPEGGPWFTQLLDADGRLADDGRWNYGVSANRNAVDTFLRYHFEQGLSDRLLTSDDIYPAELLDT
ncbi:4,5-dihydroxyphthalate decarboxylase [Amycolatopsis sp. NPDC049252]|uniref:4,5-dihydroxyphthalate decarboxylase n=1 Tax=Amycolatopsis sp. NPDC049252 TaxID=3363933 RepID=UPI003716CA8E